jgi:hypothetical protein
LYIVVKYDLLLWSKTVEFFPVQAMKATGKVEVQLHSFLTLAVDGGEWPASHFGHFAAGVHWIRGWVGARVGLDVSEKRDISCPYQDSNPGSSSL